MNDKDLFNAHIAEFLYKQVIYHKTTANIVMKLYSDMPSAPSRGGGGGVAVAQSVERATTGQEVPGSIPAVAARSLLVGSVSV